MIRRKLFLVLAGAALALAAAGIASATTPSLVANGDFETGTLAYWTTFTTANGTINGGDVQSFDTTGGGASDAAHFNVGDAVFSGAYEGGGIYQDFVGWPASVSVYVAAHGDPLATNGDCGKFEVLLDNAVLASHDFGICAANATVRWHFYFGVRNSHYGEHELRIRVTRPFAATPGVTPDQYVDNVLVTNKIYKA